MIHVTPIALYTVIKILVSKLTVMITPDTLCIVIKILVS